MVLSINASNSVLTGPKDTLDEIYSHFSFTDKAAENQLRRWKKGLFWTEKGLYQKHGELPETYLQWKKTKKEELEADVHVHCCEFQGNKLIVPTGLASGLEEYCFNLGLKLQIIDERDFDIGRRLLTGSKFNLRKPQTEAIKIFTAEDRRPTLKGLGVFEVATGVGKTALSVELIRHYGVKSIFLVPSVSILNQTVLRFEEAFGKKNVKTYGAGSKQVGFITVATYQSVSIAEEGTFDDVKMVISDECHHTPADSFYEAVHRKVKNAVYRVGLTAFSERADGSSSLIEATLGPIVYKYDVGQAISDGYLATPTFIMYDVLETIGEWTQYKQKDGKRSAVKKHKSVEYNGDDHIEAYRNWILGNDKLNGFVADMAQAFVAEGKSVLVLVKETEHGEALKDLIPDAGYAIGGGSDNDSLLKEFNKRKLKCLIGTSCLSEGTDTIPVDVLINLQGSASPSKIIQANGRALRNEVDDNGVPQKLTSLILDFNFPLCDMMKRHASIREKIHKTMGEVHKSKLY